MGRFCSKYAKPVMFCMMVLICVSFLVQLVTLGKGYKDDVNAQAAERAENYAREQSLYIKGQFNALRDRAGLYAAALGSLTRETDAKEMLHTIRSELFELDHENFRDLLYFRDGKLYGIDGFEVTGYAELEKLGDANGINGIKITRAFQYDNNLMTIGVSAPVENSFAERIVFLYARSVISLDSFAYEGQSGADINGESDSRNKLIDSVAAAELLLLCKHDGIIVERIINSDKIDPGNEPVQSGFFRSLVNDRDAERRLEALTTGDIPGSEQVNTDGRQYLITVDPFGGDNAGMFLVGMYDMEKMYGNAYAIINTIWGTLIMLGIILLSFVVVFIFNYIKTVRRINRMKTVDEMLDCYTQEGFEDAAGEILDRNRTAQYAIVMLRAINFNYIAEKYGDTQSTNTLKYIRNVCTNMTVLEEAVAYAGDGHFLLLLHYNDKKALVSRLSSMNSTVTQYNGFPDNGYKLNIAYSIYEVERSGEKQTVHRMIDKVRMAENNAAARYGSLTYDFYGDMLRENYFKRAEIEGRMQSALENNEFHLFYQPKYNLNRGGMDGSEILVRWFDEKIDKYRNPGEFLPIFEENGFINKLDRFVFYRACENMADRVKNGLTVYPVSVNVSRVTAIQPDFVSYYVRIKRKFNIRNGYITLEFTESFAYENYEYLSDVISELHTAGFLCSLDDFGTGYSSFAVLKLLDLDEIKIDKSLLDKSEHPERDRILLQSIIDMINKLGIKITQEGIEEKEEFEMLENMGCNVIQGYFFAKPMKYTDYCEFINTNFPKASSVVNDREQSS